MRWERIIEVTCPICNCVRFAEARERGSIRRCQSCAGKAMRQDRNWTKTHGESKTPLYRVWSAMKTRCTANNSTFWKDYGGRGIKLCQEWMGWPAFRDWAIPNGYSKGLLLDRRNNNGNYEPENCRWVTSAVSARNRRDTQVDMKMAWTLQELHRQGFSPTDMAWVFGLKLKSVHHTIYDYLRVPTPS